MRSWRFTYRGPRLAVDDRGCLMCSAVATGRNYKTGGQMGPDVGGCPVAHIVRRKAAGLRVHCPNHGGLIAALDAHIEEHAEHDPKLFEDFRATVLSVVSAMGVPADCPDIVVQGSAQYDCEDLTQERATFLVSVSIPQGSDPPRPERTGDEPIAIVKRREVRIVEELISNKLDEPGLKLKGQ